MAPDAAWRSAANSGGFFVDGWGGLGMIFSELMLGIQYGGETVRDSGFGGKGDCGWPISDWGFAAGRAVIKRAKQSQFRCFQC